MLCEHCALNKQMENKRNILNNKALEKGLNLLDEEVVQLSQKLDELIVECLKCKNRFNINRSMEPDSIFGIHAAFYYYGLEHLIFNLFHYIKKGLNNNEMIYISMEHFIYDLLLEFLKIQKLPLESINFLSVKEFILSHKDGGVEKLHRNVMQRTQQAEEKGYSGIRMIGQPTFAMQETSREDFLNWEVDLSKAFENTRASILCIYDSLDYVTTQTYINEEVIKKSLDTHTHILKKVFREIV